MRAVVLIVALLGARDALAYGFMLKHDYTSCAQCHLDPSGGSVLTPYGRAQGELILRTRYAENPDADPFPRAGWLFGLLSSAPEELMLGGDVRVAVAAPALKSARVFPMQADVVAGARSGKFSASVSVGIGSQATAPATIAGDAVRVISRHHWVGYSPDEDQAVLIRFGRMALPFGLRVPEHALWARQATRTDTNVSQQHGLAVSLSTDLVRLEVMGILGNLQLAPAQYRERGYSAYVELTPRPWLALGISSALTHADWEAGRPGFGIFRHAHGAFARVSPARAVMVSAEADLLHASREKLGGALGTTGFVQLDVEPLQGLHLIGAGEWLRSPDETNPGVALGGWGGVQWFFAPHTNLRCDVFIRREVDGSTTTSLLGQVHFYL
jgi:hypothetical protein